MFFKKISKAKLSRRLWKDAKRRQVSQIRYLGREAVVNKCSKSTCRTKL